MLDLDGLKAANDQHGHDVGDQLLRQVADGLSRAVRTIDVVGRYGGDEMLVVLPETDQAGALRVAEKLRRAVRGSAVPVEEGTARTSASIGLASYPDDGRSAAELINRADMAMYEAKRRGRDQIVRYSRPADVARRAGEGMPAEGMPAEGMPAAPEIGAQGAPGDPL